MCGYWSHKKLSNRQSWIYSTTPGILPCHKQKTTNKKFLKLKSTLPQKKKEGRKKINGFFWGGSGLLKQSLCGTNCFLKINNVVSSGCFATMVSHKGHPEHTNHLLPSLLIAAACARPSRLFIFILIIFVNRRRGR